MWKYLLALIVPFLLLNCTQKKVQEYSKGDNVYFNGIQVNHVNWDYQGQDVILIPNDELIMPAKVAAIKILPDEIMYVFEFDRRKFEPIRKTFISYFGDDYAVDDKGYNMHM